MSAEPKDTRERVMARLRKDDPETYEYLFGSGEPRVLGSRPATPEELAHLAAGFPEPAVGVGHDYGALVDAFLPTEADREAFRDYLGASDETPEPVGSPQQGELRERIEESVPCTCIDAYKDRELAAPDCPLHSLVDVDAIEALVRKEVEAAFDAGRQKGIADIKYEERRRAGVQ